MQKLRYHASCSPRWQPHPSIPLRSGERNIPCQCSTLWTTLHWSTPSANWCLLGLMVCFGRHSSFGSQGKEILSSWIPWGWRPSWIWICRPASIVRAIHLIPNYAKGAIIDDKDEETAEYWRYYINSCVSYWYLLLLIRFHQVCWSWYAYAFHWWSGVDPHIIYNGPVIRGETLCTIDLYQST